MTDKIVQCPLCRASNVAHPGDPPASNPNNAWNRCSQYALSGKDNTIDRLGISSIGWQRPRRNNRSRCRFPLTQPDGSLINVFPLKRFIEVTRRDFDVMELERNVLEWIEEGAVKEQFDPAAVFAEMTSE